MHVVLGHWQIVSGWKYRCESQQVSGWLGALCFWYDIGPEHFNLAKQKITVHIHHRHLLSLLSLITDSYFAVLQWVERVDLGTAGTVQQPVPKTVTINAWRITTIILMILVQNLDSLTTQPCRCAAARPLRVGVNNLPKVVARRHGDAGIRTRDRWVASRMLYHTAIESSASDWLNCVYSTVALVPPMATTDVWRGIT